MVAFFLRFGSLLNDIAERVWWKPKNLGTLGYLAQVQKYRDLRLNPRTICSLIRLVFGRSAVIE